MAARAAAFSDPDVIALLRKAFVPVAVNCSGLQYRAGPEGDYFRQIAEQGHYAGRVYPTDTRQGLYCATPDGTLLASCNVREAQPLLEILQRALATPRSAGSGLEIASDPRQRRHPPPDGLVLRVWARDLPRPAVPSEAWHRTAFNLDHVWLTATEAQALLPPDAVAGTECPWPQEVVWRLARFHLLDNVRGETPPWPPEAVRRAHVRTVVRSRAPGALEGAFHGRVELACTQCWRNDADGAARSIEAGMDLELSGSATWEDGAFQCFELVAWGSRWGSTQYNSRERDPGPAPIGFVFELAAPGRPEGLLGDAQPPARIGERYFAAAAAVAP